MITDPIPEGPDPDAVRLWEVGTRLKASRLASGLSQARLARISGVISQSRLGLVEKGKYPRVTLAMVLALCDCTMTDPVEIVRDLYGPIVRPKKKNKKTVKPLDPSTDP